MAKEPMYVFRTASGRWHWYIGWRWHLLPREDRRIIYSYAGLDRLNKTEGRR